MKYENVDYKKSEIFKHPSLRYSPIVKYENLDFKNVGFQTSVFSIFAHSQIRKLGWMFKVLDFQAYVFRIEEHFDKSKLMISGHVSSFSSFMPIVVLVEK